MGSVPAEGFCFLRFIVSETLMWLVHLIFDYLDHATLDPSLTFEPLIPSYNTILNKSMATNTSICENRATITLLREHHHCAAAAAAELR